ncbi:MAG TPA: histidine kinase dimerization/phospho-acceptor domain-containing protein, partial [Ohtaekwangia sp.]|uniref:sensor histidine kinase n=1 Tax=Ohtaekwangia sp. TaxID=2066019 RepID=UPI002F91C541
MMIRALTTVGVTEQMPRLQARAVILSNRIAIIAIVLTALFLSYSLRSKWSFTHQMVLVTFIALCTTPLLNRIGAIYVSRILLTITIPLTSLTILLINRIQMPESFEYQRSPGIYSILLATAIIPALIFSNQERKLMYIGIGANFTAFALLDIILRFYSTRHQVPTVTQYMSANLVLFISYFLLIGSVLSLKRVADIFEQRNNQLIEDLNAKNAALENTNRELHELNKNIETQNEEIQAQSEELHQSQESLIMANNEIERQRGELESQNKFLEKTLDEKNRDLLHTNQQLVMQNNELQQFSYTVSHNMRGPVASIIGLMNIHRLANSADEQSHILELIEQSAYSLETIIRDLNKIVDIRNDRFTVYEDVSLPEEVKLIRQSLKSFTQENVVRFDLHLAYDKIISIKAYINSILYNLISNGIQYRSPDRPLVIGVSSKYENGHAVITVTDNGLGIDLVRYKDDLFKLYKRFHTHTQGKG